MPQPQPQQASWAHRVSVPPSLAATAEHVGEQHVREKSEPDVAVAAEDRLVHRGGEDATVRSRGLIELDNSVWQDVPLVDGHDVRARDHGDSRQLCRVERQGRREGEIARRGSELIKAQPHPALAQLL